MATKTWSGCGGRCRSSTRWPSAAPSGSGELLTVKDYVQALGALTGNQAVQQVKAGLKAIYLSGWQVAADANLAGADVSRPEPLPGELRARSGAAHQQGAAARRPDRARRGQATSTSTGSRRSSPTPRPASAAPLNAFELMKAMIEAGRRRRALRGPAGLREEVRPHGRQGAGPDRQSIRNLIAARLAADVLGVPT